jgi:site-specific DNA-methyltransferase (adenine-specific)
MSSLTPEWATPLDFFQTLHDEFGFTLDVCAAEWNYKCPRYFTASDNGLEQSWANEICYMNPPYGREIAAWMRKAYEESVGGGATVICLIPARTDTAWWHDFAMKGTVRFIRGRLKFLSVDGVKSSAPFPSAVVIFPRQ